MQVEALAPGGVLVTNAGGLMQVEALAPGGVLVVCFWPSTVEQDGPWAQFRALLAARSAAAGDFVGLPPPPSSKKNL